MSKIAIPVKEKSLQSAIDDRFARAPYILIYDDENNGEEWIDNSATDAHGAGPKMVQSLLSRGVNVIIAPQLGQNAFMAVQSGGIKAFNFKGDTIRQILDNFAQGALTEILQSK